MSSLNTFANASFCYWRCQRSVYHLLLCKARSTAGRRKGHCIPPEPADSSAKSGLAEAANASIAGILAVWIIDEGNTRRRCHLAVQSQARRGERASGRSESLRVFGQAGQRAETTSNEVFRPPAMLSVWRAWRMEQEPL